MTGTEKISCEIDNIVLQYYRAVRFTQKLSKLKEAIHMENTYKTRHEWQSYMLHEELQDEPWEWEIDYWSYLCIARKKVSE